MTAWYNEIDPYAADWLEALIAAGHIAPGVVDRRSIADVRADDLLGYDQCHFFAGIGGWSLALRMAGWADSRPVWTGSCPCQPFSAAGKRKGFADERHLWPEFHRLIGECRPPVVFGEQVASKDGRTWLAGVRADLEALGYAVGAADLCAAGIGAPHIRQRLWWVAHANGGLSRNGELQPGRQHGLIAQDDGIGRMGNSHRTELSPHRGSCLAERDEARSECSAQSGSSGGLADADQGQRGRLADGEGRLGDGPAAGWLQGNGESQSSGVSIGLGNSNDQGSQERGGGPDEQPGSQGREAAQRSSGLSGVFNHWSDFDLVHCTDGKARRVEPGTFPLAHGVPARVAKLRALGNAIVPQVAAEFIGAYLDCRNMRIDDFDKTV